MKLNMMLVLQLLCLMAISATATAKECDACIDGSCYETHPLRPHNCRISLGSDVKVARRTNSAYYLCYEKDIKYNVCAYQLNNDSTEICIPARQSYYRYAIDQKTGSFYARSVYRPGLNGVHKYDVMTNSMEIILPYATMEYIYFKDVLYFSVNSTFDTKGLLKYANDTIVEIPGLQDIILSDFVVDKNDDIYFKKRYGGGGRIYLLKKDAKEVEVIVNTPSSRRFITTDKDDNVVFVSKSAGTSMTMLHRLEQGELVFFGVIDSAVLTSKVSFDSDNNVIFCSGKKPLSWKHLRKNYYLRCTFTENTTAPVITVLGTGTTIVSDSSATHNI